MRPIFDRLEVLRRRGPASVGVEKVFFRLTGESIIGNLIFLKSALIADPPAPVPEVEFARRPVADRARMILFAQRFQ